jgi:hypothetical protein
MIITLKKNAIVLTSTDNSINLKPLLYFVNKNFQKVKHFSNSVVIYNENSEEIKKKYLLKWAYKIYEKSLSHNSGAFLQQLIASHSLPIYVVTSKYSHFGRVNTEDKPCVESLYEKKLQKSYIILSISDKSTDGEMKKNYRNMLKKHHPDIVYNQNEDLVKLYTRRFQVIQNAYEFVREHRL